MEIIIDKIQQWSINILHCIDRSHNYKYNIRLLLFSNTKCQYYNII